MPLAAALPLDERVRFLESCLAGNRPTLRKARTVPGATQDLRRPLQLGENRFAPPLRDTGKVPSVQPAMRPRCGDGAGILSVAVATKRTRHADRSGLLLNPQLISR